MGGQGGLKRMPQSRRQRFNSGCAGRVRGSDPQMLDPPGPIKLVVMLGDDDLGCSGSRRGRRGARSAVMDDGGDLFKQCLLVDFADG